MYDERRDAVRIVGPINAAVRGHYYSFLNESGEAVEEVESNLAEFEGKAKPVLESLAARRMIGDRERFDLSVFLGFLACRTPFFERAANELVTGLAEVVIRRNLADPEVDELAGLARAEVEALLESGEFKLAVHQNERISQMVDRGPELGKAFFVSDWVVLHTDEQNAFVTSDNPFAVVDPSEVPEDGGFQRYGIASPEVTTSFPLSCGQSLLLSGEGGGLVHCSATKGQVRRINFGTVLASEELVVARDERHLRSLVRRAGLGPGRAKFELRMEEFPHPSGDPRRSILVTGRRRR